MEGGGNETRCTLIFRKSRVDHARLGVAVRWVGLSDYLLSLTHLFHGGQGNQQSNICCKEGRAIQLRSLSSSARFGGLRRTDANAIFCRMHIAKQIRCQCMPKDAWY